MRSGPNGLLDGADHQRSLPILQAHRVEGDDVLVAEGWVTKRGRRIVFCEVEVRTVTAVKVATGHLLYQVGDPPTPS